MKSWIARPPVFFAATLDDVARLASSDCRLDVLFLAFLCPEEVEVVLDSDADVCALTVRESGSTEVVAFRPLRSGRCLATIVVAPQQEHTSCTAPAAFALLLCGLRFEVIWGLCLLQDQPTTSLVPQALHEEIVVS